MRTRKRSVKKLIAADVEILPLMNLFVVLIPMLLLSAVFIELRVIRMAPPPEAMDKADEMNGAGESLALAVTIRDDVYVIEGKGIRRVAIGRSTPDAMDELRLRLSEISDAHPDEKEVMIIAGEETRYDDIVSVMDVARDSGLPAIALMGSEIRDGELTDA